MTELFFERKHNIDWIIRLKRDGTHHFPVTHTFPESKLETPQEDFPYWSCNFLYTLQIWFWIKPKHWFSYFVIMFPFRVKDVLPLLLDVGSEPWVSCMLASSWSDGLCSIDSWGPASLHLLFQQNCRIPNYFPQLQTQSTESLFQVVESVWL